MKISSSELQNLIELVRDAISDRPTDLDGLDSALENLLLFLTSPAGRTDRNCTEADSYFCLYVDNGLDWDHLPQDYRSILDDIGGQLHDTIDNPDIAANFESTPEQLLTRIRNLRIRPL